MERMLSVGQEALWLLYRMAPRSAAYNVAWAMRVRGPFDVTALRRAFGLVAARQDLLRSRFVERGGVPRRIVCDELLKRFPEFDVDHDGVTWAPGNYVRRPLSVPITVPSGPST